MRFIVDTNLPPALARWLEAEGHEAQHTTDLAMEGAADRAIWNRAREMDAAS